MGVVGVGAEQADDVGRLGREPHGLGDRGVGLGEPGRAAVDAPKGVERMHHRQLAPRRREIGILLHGALEQFLLLAQVGCRRRRGAVARVTALEIKIVGHGIFGGAAFEEFLCLRRNRRRERGRDFLRDGGLDGENIREVAIVALRPDVLVVARVDELAGDADLAAGAAHAALENVGDAKFLADLPHGLGRAAILEHGGARDHLQLGHDGEVRQQILVDAVGEEPGVLVLAHVGEREDGDGFVADLRRRQRRGGLGFRDGLRSRRRRRRAQKQNTGYHGDNHRGGHAPSPTGNDGFLRHLAGL